MDLKERIQTLCKKNEISMNQLEQELGFGKGYISKLSKSTPNTTKIQHIADFFGVSVDFLMSGKKELAPRNPILTARDERDMRDIEKILTKTREQLLSQEGLMFNKAPATPEAIEAILSAMEVGMELAKRKNKEIYPPNKYKKD